MLNTNTPESEHIKNTRFAKRCFKDKDYTNAFEYSQKADQEDADIQANLGWMYQKGKGTPQDYDKAFEWYQKSTEQDNAKGQSGLGWIHIDGKGTTVNYAQALKLINKAVAQNEARAQNNLGYMYRTGKGVEKDQVKAIEWYRKSADQNHPRGQCNLGSMYRTGQGVEKDYIKAVEWYQKSADQDDPRGQRLLGDMYEYGYGVAKDHAKAMKLYYVAANQDNAARQRDNNDTDYVKTYIEILERVIENTDNSILAWFDADWSVKNIECGELENEKLITRKNNYIYKITYKGRMELARLKTKQARLQKTVKEQRWFYRNQKVILAIEGAIVVVVLQVLGDIFSDIFTDWVIRDDSQCSKPHEIYGLINVIDTSKCK